MRLIIALLTTLYVNQTIASDYPSIVIKAGDKAKYNGVLVPEYKFREDEKCLDKLPICEDDLKKSQEITSDRTVSDDLIVFGLGILGGVLLGAVFRK